MIQKKSSLLEASHNRFWKRLCKNRSAQIGGVIVGTLLFLAIFAGWIAPYQPTARADLGRHAEVSSTHWLGTDQDAFDVFSRLIYGSRLSLMAGTVSMTLAITVGGFLGVTAGYFGKWVDVVIMRAMDIMLSFPSLLLAILVVMATSRTSWIPVMVAVGLINVPVFCRQVRATVLTVRNLDYVTASRAMGATWPHILVHVILPAIINPVIVLATLGLGTAVLEVAGLSFLGIGGQPDDPEWGSMLSAAKEHISSALLPIVMPGIAISFTVLGFNLLGDGLRDVLDPHLVRRE